MGCRDVNDKQRGEGAVSRRGLKWLKTKQRTSGSSSSPVQHPTVFGAHCSSGEEAEAVRQKIQDYRTSEHKKSCCL